MALSKKDFSINFPNVNQFDYMLMTVNQITEIDWYTLIGIKDVASNNVNLRVDILRLEQPIDLTGLSNLEFQVDYFETDVDQKKPDQSPNVNLWKNAVLNTNFNLTGAINVARQSTSATKSYAGYDSRAVVFTRIFYPNVNYVIRLENIDNANLGQSRAIIFGQIKDLDRSA